MVLCWVEIDQKTGRVQDFSDLEKCSMYQSVEETKLMHWRTDGEPVSYWSRRQIDIVGRAVLNSFSGLP